jgi:hypothetical protein
MLLIILCLLILILIFLYLSRKTYEHFFDEKNEEYTEFYNKLMSDSIDQGDKCKLVKQQITDYKQGIEISKPILNASYNYNSNYCENSIKQSEKIDIEPSNPEALNKYYEKYCFPKYGKLKYTHPFTKYTVSIDENGNKLFDGVTVEKIELNKQNCRNLEEYIMNSNNDDNKPEKTINELYDECKLKYKPLELETHEKKPYKYNLSRDGKYYLNNESLDQVSIGISNCKIVNDIIKNNKNEEIEVENLNDDIIKQLCKKSDELELMCSVYDKQKLLDYGKNRDIQPKLYEYELGKEKYEYSYLHPNEHYHITRKNINFSVEKQMDICFRKMAFDKKCQANAIREANAKKELKQEGF